MNPLTTEFIQCKSIIKSHPLPGDGAQAPGAITLREWGEQWATHFYNAQDGGFHSGHYFNNLPEAEVDFVRRAIEYAPLQAIS